MQNSDRIVITIHGIRTFGQWQDRLKDLLTQHDPRIKVQTYSYGYFSVIAFLIPIFRWIAVRRFRQQFIDLVQDNPNTEFAIVAHSFGTHIVGRALAEIPPEKLPIMYRLILSGSVLQSKFDFSSTLRTGKLRGVVNDCGLNDNVLILSQLMVLFTGMAGRVGFYGLLDDRVVNRFHTGGHSHYFILTEDGSSPFMEQWWLPLLLTDKPPRKGPPRPQATVASGVAHSIMQIADPIKIIFYAGLALALGYFGFFQPREIAAAENVSRLIAYSELQTERVEHHLALNSAQGALNAALSSYSKPRLTDAMSRTFSAATNFLIAKKYQNLPQGNFIALVQSDSGTSLFYEDGTIVEVNKEFQTTNTLHHEFGFPISRVFFASGKSLYLVTGEKGQASILDKKYKNVESFSTTFTVTGFSSNGDHIVGRSGIRGAVGYLNRTSREAQIVTCVGGDQAVASLNPDGTILLVSTRRGLCAFDTANMRRTFEVDLSDESDIARFSRSECLSIRKAEFLADHFVLVEPSFCRDPAHTKERFVIDVKRGRFEIEADPDYIIWGEDVKVHRYGKLLLTMDGSRVKLAAISYDESYADVVISEKFEVDSGVNIISSGFTEDYGEPFTVDITGKLTIWKSAGKRKTIGYLPKIPGSSALGYGAARVLGVLSRSQTIVLDRRWSEVHKTYVPKSLWRLSSPLEEVVLRRNQLFEEFRLTPSCGLVTHKNIAVNDFYVSHFSIYQPSPRQFSSFSAPGFMLDFECLEKSSSIVGLGSKRLELIEFSLEGNIISRNELKKFAESVKQPYVTKSFSSEEPLTIPDRLKHWDIAPDGSNVMLCATLGDCIILESNLSNFKKIALPELRDIPESDLSGSRETYYPEFRNLEAHFLKDDGTEGVLVVQREDRTEHFRWSASGELIELPLESEDVYLEFPDGRTLAFSEGQEDQLNIFNERSIRVEGLEGSVIAVDYSDRLKQFYILHEVVAPVTGNEALQLTSANIDGKIVWSSSVETGDHYLVHSSLAVEPKTGTVLVASEHEMIFFNGDGELLFSVLLDGVVDSIKFDPSGSGLLVVDFRSKISLLKIPINADELLKTLSKVLAACELSTPLAQRDPKFLPDGFPQEPDMHWCSQMSQL